MGGEKWEGRSLRIATALLLVTLLVAGMSGPSTALMVTVDDPVGTLFAHATAVGEFDPEIHDQDSAVFSGFAATPLEVAASASVYGANGHASASHESVFALRGTTGFELGILLISAGGGNGGSGPYGGAGDASISFSLDFTINEALDYWINVVPDWRGSTDPHGTGTANFSVSLVGVDQGSGTQSCSSAECPISTPPFLLEGRLDPGMYTLLISTDSQGGGGNAGGGSGGVNLYVGAVFDDPVIIPEPTTALLLASGLLGLAMGWRN